jgi:hypothetical protein
MNRGIIVFRVAVWIVAVVAFLSARTLAPAVIFQTQTVDAIRDTPLLAARRNLLLARSRVLKHEYPEAIPSLLATADALAYFEEQQLGQRGSDAGWVRQEIEDYADGIETDHSDALDRITAWLDQIRGWEGRK